VSKSSRVPSWIVGILTFVSPLGLMPGCAESCRAQEACGDTCAQSSGAVDTSCLHCRTNLTGDWFGRRSALAANGITFQGDVTQYYQGVTDGGRQQRFKYGGHADYVINMDLGKLGAWQGLFLKLRGESQFGEFVNSDTGALLAANTEGLMPTIGGQETALTNFVLTQFLSESFAVFAGKIDAFDGDRNAFAHGRGKDQFMNVGFVANPIGFRTIPYSTYGAGFILLNGTEPIFSFTVLDPVDHATAGPTNLFGEGVTLASELRLPTSFFGMPGHQLIGGTWSNRDVPDLSRLLIAPGTPIATASDSWSLYWNFDHYLVTDPCDESRGWGIFGRAAVADDDTNPLGTFLSFGVGGSSPIAGRKADSFGVGWYRASSSNALPGLVFGEEGDGVELYYNVAVTPWLHITPDIQFIDPARRGVDSATVLGIRMKMDL